MAEITAIATTGLEGGAFTDDGHHALLRFSTSSGPVAIAMPMTDLRKLGVLALSMGDQQPSAHPGVETAIEVLPVSWWTAGRTEDGSLILSFELHSGGKLAFRLSEGSMQGLLEALSPAEGQRGPPPGTIPN